MKIKAIQYLVFVFTLVLYVNTIFGQAKRENVSAEINATLQLWNQTAKKADLNGFLSLFDDTDRIMLVGSDSGEIFKGKEQIAKWLGMLFKNNSFEWDMKRIDIDSYKKTAWVFVDGYMIVTNNNGKLSKTPYRFSGILVKRNKTWKWRLFDGSIPHGE